MKKRILAIALAICLFCCALPMSASATNISTGAATTRVSYTVGSSYSVVIPAMIDLNNQNGFQITATNCNIGEGRRLVVAIDGGKSYTSSGNFYLYKDKGMENEKTMLCRVALKPSATASGNYIEGLDQVVATFNDGSTSPDSDGYLEFVAFPTGAEIGTYTGTLSFIISVEDAL